MDDHEAFYDPTQPVMAGQVQGYIEASVTDTFEIALSRDEWDYLKALREFQEAEAANARFRLEFDQAQALWRQRDENTSLQKRRAAERMTAIRRRMLNGATP